MSRKKPTDMYTTSCKVLFNYYLLYNKYTGKLLEGHFGKKHFTLPN